MHDWDQDGEEPHNMENQYKSFKARQDLNEGSINQ